MAINAVVLAVTASPGVTCQAVAASLTSWVDRLRLSFLWPTSSRVSESGNKEGARLCVVFDRLIFVVSAVSLVIVCVVP